MHKALTPCGGQIPRGRNGLSGFPIPLSEVHTLYQDASLVWIAPPLEWGMPRHMTRDLLVILAHQHASI
jgi:hypothetical protein